MDAVVTEVSRRARVALGTELESFVSKKKTGQLSLARLHSRLEASDVRGLQTFRSAGDLEFNGLSFVERFVPFGLNGRKVYENILAGLALDEPETLAGVEPFHCSLFSH